MYKAMLQPDLQCVQVHWAVHKPAACTAASVHTLTSTAGKLTKIHFQPFLCTRVPFFMYESQIKDGRAIVHTYYVHMYTIQYLL